MREIIPPRTSPGTDTPTRSLDLRRRPKASDDEVRRRLLNAGYEVLKQFDFPTLLFPVRYEDTIQRTGEPRSSAYRCFRTVNDFHTALSSYAYDQEQPYGLDALAEVVENIHANQPSGSQAFAMFGGHLLEHVNYPLIWRLKDDLTTRRESMGAEQGPILDELQQSMDRDYSTYRLYLEDVSDFAVPQGVPNRNIADTADRLHALASGISISRRMNMGCAAVDGTAFSALLI